MTNLKDSLFKYHHQLLDCTIFFYLFTPLSDRVERKSSLPFQFFKKTENGYFIFMIARARGKIFEVGSSPNLMSDNPKSTIFATSKLFPSFSSEVIRSPTSILESKPFSVTNHPFFSERNCKKPHWSHKDSRGIGLGIIDALSNCKSDNRSLNSSSRMIVFGSQLKIQIPQVESSSNSSTGSVESPHSPIEFGIKNKDSQLALHSSSDLSIEGLPPSPEFFTREMELLEEYTCVISHGPNPKKTHIFDNCIMENCDDGFAMWKKENRVFSEKSSDYLSADFLSFCHACKKTLVCKDIFMYRGEIAFCSRECRQQEMISDDELRSAL